MAWSDIFRRVGNSLNSAVSKIDWGSVGSSALSALTNHGSSYRNFKYASALQKQAFDYQLQSQQRQYDLTRQLNQNAYQDTTQSMRNAGINPMLAISQGINGMTAGTGSSPGAGSASSEASDLIASAAAWRQMKNETELKNSQTSLNKSQEDVNDYLKDKAHEEAAYTNEQTRQLMEYGPRVQEAQIKNIEANTSKALTDALNSTKLTNSQINVNSAQSQSIRYGNEELSARSRYVKEHPKLYNFGQAFSDVSGAVGLGVGAVAGGAVAGYNKLKNRKKKVGF